jgi:hypothetical protein
MSQLILDENVDLQRVLPHLPKKITAQSIQSLRPGERILDERVPEILLTLKQPTFVTIDRGFWHPRWCHPDYCIAFFAVQSTEQEQLTELLRAFLRLPEFHTRASRVGKVAHVSPTRVDY